MKLVSTLLSTLVFVSACGVARPVALTTGASRLSDTTSESGIRNFHTVDATLFRSGSLRVSDFDTLDSLGVRSILTLEQDGERTPAIRAEQAAAREHGIEWLRLPMDGGDAPTVAQLNEALRIIADQDHAHPILVHCLHGADRTGMVIAAYRIKHDGWTVERAIEEMRGLGHIRSLYWWDDVLYDIH